jgi:hypothetical protein
MSNPVSSPFNWRGPSQVVDNLGRIKSDRQRLLDATRVNAYSDSGRSTTPPKSETAPR